VLIPVGLDGNACLCRD